MKLTKNNSYHHINDNYNSIRTKEIKQSYIYVFIILAVLSIINFTIIQWMTSIQEQNIALVEPVEKIQENILEAHDSISLILHAIENNTLHISLHQKIQTKLAKNADNLEKQLKILKTIIKENDIPILSINLNSFFYKSPYRIEQKLTSAIDKIKELSTLHPNQYYWNFSLWLPIESMLSKQSILEKGIKLIREKIRHSVSEKFTYLSRLHNLLILVTLLLLLAESYYIFIPMLRSIQLRDKEFFNHYEKIKEYAYTDSLISNIGNRRALLLTMNKLKTKNDNKLYTLIFIDINKFKSINDAYGYTVGDYILHMTAQRIKHFLSTYNASVFRIDGNKYAIHLTMTNDTHDIYSFAHKLLDVIHDTLVYQGHTISLNTSIGLTSFFLNKDTSLESLLDQAEFALSLSKKDKNKPIYIYSEEKYNKYFGSKKLAKDLAIAIKKDEIVPYYQPIVNISNNKIIAVEALARWKKNDTEVLQSESFLKIVKNYNLMKAMTESILKQVYHDYLLIEKNAHFCTKMSVNFTKSLLLKPNLAKYLSNLLKSENLNWLQVEILEDVTLDDSRDFISNNLTQLQNLGATIALDDYGTGYASLTHLMDFPCNTLKIDRSFVSDILQNIQAQHIISGIINISEGLNMNVLIEGVETEEQYNFFKKWPKVSIQGYYIAKPMPIKELILFCKERGVMS